MNQPITNSTREALPDHLRWICDNCRYAISPGKPLVAVTVNRCIRQDGEAIAVNQISDPQYFCEDCAASLNFNLRVRSLPK